MLTFPQKKLSETFYEVVLTNKQAIAYWNTEITDNYWFLMFSTVKIQWDTFYICVVWLIGF